VMCFVYAVELGWGLYWRNYCVFCLFLPSNTSCRADISCSETYNYV